MIDRDDPLWFKDALIYQLHVKAFFDANDDGIGDFAGLLQKLDYVRELGVTALWLLPFYPSPLRDDGYDIADYRTIQPAYGTMRDFKKFLKAAHARGLRVITELVVNHTSDQHPWFQRARTARPGSAARNFYVWSDTDQRYQSTRIIFLDTENSNWAWDPVAESYYWHRFYSHQPDLNYDNPRVLKEVLKVLDHWLQMGVDGLRLDAVPYLCEREGTNSENLAETHAVLKMFRTHLETRYSDRLLLGEANQWPEDTQEYFGAGDECHMAFHFPLMPRMYMGIAQEDRHPITDILRQTPDIPDSCQWAVFLRNHDELTLEMVTDQERDYLWNFYATDRRMRLNLGIRRRLAPLLDNDRRKIELMNGLLLSMPGTPIVYYGDEIGMGDNIFLGDRDGVRTPMQWSPDRNGGFSRADPARLYLPPNMDAVYGYEALNVEAQTRSSGSLLNWMKRLIGARKAHRSFGRGNLTLLYPGNRKVLAYLREYQDEAILCVANLSRAAQAVELDLSRFNGRVPIELLGRSPFPPIGELPYLLTLTGYGFHWFILAQQAEAPRWHEPLPDLMPEYVTLVMREGWRDLASGRSRGQLEQDVLPGYLPIQRWFGAKDETVRSVRLGDWAELPGDGGAYLLQRLDVELSPSRTVRQYFLPLAVSWEQESSSAGSPLLPFTLAKVRRGPRVGLVFDATAAPGFALSVLNAMREEREIGSAGGRFLFSATSRMDEVDPGAIGEVRRLSVEQSNSSILIGDKAILKIYRRLVAGVHPEVEIARFLTEVDYRNTPALLGAVEHVAPDGSPTALAILQSFVANQGDGWNYTLDYLDRTFEEIRLTAGETEAIPAEQRHSGYLVQAATLGRRTGELHRAFAQETDDPAFATEPITQRDLKAWRRGIQAQARAAFAAVKSIRGKLSGELRQDAERFLAERKLCSSRIADLTAAPVETVKSRLHGDYHLGQVLLVKDDFYILDFEGEPARTLEERRAKNSPLKDVAGMLRSFDYASSAALRRLSENGNEPTDRVRAEALAWRETASRAFLEAYQSAMVGSPSWPADPKEAKRLIDLFTLEKALYEVSYEAGNRPQWLGIPIRGVLALLESEGEGEQLARE